jgi:hypothetical protein
MTAFKYPNLFKPIRLGNTLFSNRLFAAPTGCLDLSHGGIPTPAAVAYYERKALGGAAAVTMGTASSTRKRDRSPPTSGALTSCSPCRSCGYAGRFQPRAVASVELQHGECLASRLRAGSPL